LNNSWIVFNKPAQLDATHAGVLFALGLQGKTNINNTQI